MERSLLFLIFTFSVCSASFLCFKGTYHIDVLPEDKTEDYNYACCATVSLDGNVEYFGSSEGSIRKKMSVSSKYAGKSCAFSGKDFSCCCDKHDMCNSNAFLRYHLLKYMEDIKQTGSGSEVAFIGFFFGLLVVAVVAGTCIGRFMSGQMDTPNTAEVAKEKTFEEKSVFVLPQLSKGELAHIKQQIRHARTTEKPTIKSLTGTLSIKGVYTYNTNTVVTNRELTSIELKIPAKGPKDFMAILMQMITIGPREIKFPFSIIDAVCEEAGNVFMNEPTATEAPVPCQVYGDIHGQYSDLLRFLHLNGWPPTVRCVFLGDYVDRGRHCLEVIMMLFLLKIVMPYDVYMVRGNHEDAIINKSYSFFSEIEYRIPHDNQNHYRTMAKFIDTFTKIPLAVRIGKRVMGVHGGLSPKMDSWDTIINIRRPCNLKKGTLMCDITWSDPEPTATGFEPNLKRDPNGGMGYQFGVDALNKVTNDLKVDLLLRGHQCPMNGYELFGERCITVFTAPGYRSSGDGDSNHGCSIFIDHDFRLIMTRITVDNNVRVIRDMQKLDKGEVYNDMGTLKTKKHHDDDC
ncbi:unnamed protein product [Bursaphelenchus okinawaensis]|uniref:Serine/threonine-protein phosphatase n=1 Tax=Bursaphelenchus okinawaensis TaxID=465554 RepID=A0A811KMX2_9BILA|nr:unnamed protein product [Bursaphelenchus okinawaensis]CAG9105889.1 unnamed protein product [Bursaphelenchus okinawaensis]